MKFGIFYEHQLPRPWNNISEYQLLQDSLTQIELADKLGYDYAWEVEHHFLEEYSHSSAPEVFLGAASQRTKNIRLGHGVIQITTNDPHRVAERVATLDLLSGGRVELGMGEGAGPAELHPFGVRVRSKRDRWEEAVKAIVPMFTREDWEFHGEFHDFPARNVIPSPIRSRTRRCGSRARTSRPSARLANGAWGRWASPLFRPTPPPPGCINITTICCTVPIG
jgi:alkanesulfonate monooxygenase SsuD/methylene tetrahydromethanopterin reductase-like flavin-dependent oxidoreductase (luciferase family)